MTDSHRFDLRIPLDLHELLVEAAEDQDRSLNREIVFRLRRSFVGEVASARTREVAGAQPDPPGPVEVKTDMTDIRGEPITIPVSLPDTARYERHRACKKNFQHHIYHGGRPCPLCGYPA